MTLNKSLALARLNRASEQLARAIESARECAEFEQEQLANMMRDVEEFVFRLDSLEETLASLDQ
jgi:ribosome-binding protein aMBF1 (putative translation factor)